MRQFLAAIAYGFPIMLAVDYIPDYAEIVIGFIIAHLVTQEKTAKWVYKYK